MQLITIHFVGSEQQPDLTTTLGDDSASEDDDEFLENQIESSCMAPVSREFLIYMFFIFLLKCIKSFC